MMMRFSYILTILILSIAIFFPQESNGKKKTVDIYDLSLDDNISTPEIDNDKQSQSIQEYQYDAAVSLKKQNYDVEMMRNNEVIVITIPAGQLFNPNDTSLTDLGIVSLKPLLRYLKNPGFYKILLVMHSDNTGSDKYTLDLSRSRVNSVYDWFDSNGSVDFVVPYALGATDPLDSNNSMEKRKRNRRLEIYLVPGDIMINQSKRGKIDINLILK
jgi:outer membrane protein OmpA-like peptidoglycan-associated protein